MDEGTDQEQLTGTVLENTLLQREIQTRAQQLAALHDLSHSIGSTLDLDQVLRLTLERTCELFQAALGTAYLADLAADVARQRAVVGIPKTEAERTAQLSLDASLAGQVILTGRPLFIGQGLPAEPALGEQSNAQAAAFIPLSVGEHVLGTLNLAFDKPRPFNADDRALLIAIGRQVGMALANARFFQEVVTAERKARRRAGQLAALHEIDKAINSSLEPAAVYTCIVEQAVGLLDCQIAILFLWDEKAQEAIGVAGFVDPTTGQSEVSSQDLVGQGLDAGYSQVIRDMSNTRLPLAINDADQDLRIPPDRRQRLSIRALLALPLISREQIVGFLHLIDQTGPRQWAQDEITLAGQLAAQAAIAIHKTRLLDDLQRANRRLLRLDELKDQFIQNVAHELRTPLTLVRGNLSLLIESDLSLKEQQQAIRTAAFHTEALVQLIEGITTLQDLHITGATPQSMNLFELVETARQLVAQKTTRAGIKLKIEHATDLPAWPGDFVQLSQALYQLLDNAIKFSPKASTVTLQLYIDRGENELHIQVNDQGIGIPPEEQENIFDVFYQVDGTTTRRFGGTGLGLAIVRRVVEAHDGRVWVESPHKQDALGFGPGSKFVIRLPHSCTPPLVS